ncbi:hypothetical protein C8A03DRAFT_38332 [Achaetomium macrosporum]|uniref:Uncharacterized protein n=1 Tax=Achaetomium macrosporum TaxID=79813 RepID=A0AAN7C353_9PEZI|nr:hypothetical protein C8A03DRAFT_38332 [Achaetomium macrosporum]
MAESSDRDEHPALPPDPSPNRPNISSNRPAPALQILSSDLSELTITPPPPSDPPAPAEEPAVEPAAEPVIAPADDIVDETTKAWRQWRIANNTRVYRGQDTPKAYTLEAFVVRWVEQNGRARQLANVLIDDRVREALGQQGIAICMAEDLEEEPALKIRKEMKTLLQEPQFGRFAPHQDQAPAPAPAPAQDQGDDDEDDDGDDDEDHDEAQDPAQEDRPLPPATIAEMCETS